MSDDKDVQTSEPIRISQVLDESQMLDQAIELHKRSKRMLGPFPRGAFIDHAKRGLVLAATDGQGDVVGYTVYRVAKNRAIIAHLTTDDGKRKSGIGRALIESVKARTSELAGIGLSCRQDYGLGPVWRSYGFTVRNTKRGRGAEGAPLDFWWFDHYQDDLFTSAAVRPDEIGRPLAVLDANGFFDLTFPDRPHAEVTGVLMADWLADDLLLAISREIYNEIDRSTDPRAKQVSRASAQNFYELPTDDAEVQQVESELEPIFDDAKNERDRSDMRHVAHAITAHASFFVTRDKRVIARGEKIRDRFGLRILHPTDLVNSIDTLHRETEYQPVRLEGSTWSKRLIVAEDVDGLSQPFKHPSLERKKSFSQRFRHFYSNPRQWACHLVSNGEKTPAVLHVEGENESGRLEIPLLRHTHHKLSPTLLRHILHNIVCQRPKQQIHSILVTDEHISPICKVALEELGFLQEAGAWWKVCVPGVHEPDSVACIIEQSELPNQLISRLCTFFKHENRSWNIATTARMERLLSPVKIVSPSTPNFILSIRPDWAAHFFDIPIGAQTLLDLREHLHLGIEGVYYCSAASNRHVSAPARLLWYVSGKGEMAIKACSYLEECAIGPAREVFPRFENLGVYSWQDVLATANGRPDGEVMALRFSRTETFGNLIPLRKLREMRIPQPQNARTISQEHFFEIYQRGHQM